MVEPLRQIVLVNDDPSLLVIYKRSLEMLLPVQVTTFQSGAYALRHMSEAPIASLLIVDQEMPDMDVATLIRTLRHHPRLADIGVLAVTEARARAELLSAGATNVIAPDLSPLQIATEVQRMLSGSSGTSAAAGVV